MHKKQSEETLHGEVVLPKTAPRRVLTAGSSYMHISPLGFRVVVRIRKTTNQTQSGLYLPEGAKENNQQSLLGEVIEVASAIDEETMEDTNISGIPQGALVLIPTDVGVRVPWDDALRIVETQDVLAIVEEMDIV